MNASESSRLESVLRPAGPIAEAIAGLCWVLIAAGAVIFCAVMVMLGWALLRRRQPGDAAAAGRSGWLWVVGGGVVFPAVVLSALLVHATLRSAALAPAGDGDGMVVTVKAHLWWWEVRYRDPASGADIVLANQINLPVGRPVTLGLVSDNVIHSLWIPALAGKVDMVPGRVNQLRLQADRPGVFRGQCAEFCGEQHARMALFAVAQPPEEFERWLAMQARPAQLPTDPEARRGLEVFQANGCSQCHAVRGLAQGMGFGPDLTHLASRSHIAAATLPNDRETLARWLTDVQHVKPGARMPSYDRLDAASLQALLAFLVQLD